MVSQQRLSETAVASDCLIFSQSLALSCVAVCAELEKERANMTTALNLGKGDVNLEYNGSRGYHLSLPTSTFQTLPRQDQQMFQLIQQRGKRTHCTTEQILSLDARQSEAYAEITMLTGQHLETLLDELRLRQCAARCTRRAVLKVALPHTVLCLIAQIWTGWPRCASRWLGLT